MKKRFQGALILLLVFLVSFPYHPVAAQAATIHLNINSVDTTSFPNVSFLISAWDSSGLPITGLTTQDVVVQEDGGAQIRPTRVEVDNDAPVWVTLVMDISGSMQGQPLVDAKAAAARFLDRLGTADHAALVAFSDPVDTNPQNINPKRELSFDSDKTSLYNLIDSLQAGGNTLLYNALTKAVGLFPDASTGHRAILLLSDGQNYPANVGDPNQPIQMAQQAGVPIYVIGLGSEIDETYLQKLADSTGGVYRSAPTSADLASLFGDMATLLKTQYQVAYASQLPADGQEHVLQVTLNSSGQSVTANSSLGKLPLIPSATPTKVASATLVASSTSLPTMTLMPSTPTSLPTPTATPVPTVLAQITGSNAGRIGLLLILAALVVTVSRFRRKPTPQPEVCAKCGFDLTGKTGACPQCGETRRLPKGK